MANNSSEIQTTPSHNDSSQFRQMVEALNSLGEVARRLERSGSFNPLSVPLPINPMGFQFPTALNEARNFRPDINPTNPERRSLELEIDANHINESTGSTPSTSDPKRITPTSFKSTSWLSTASDKSQISQEQPTPSDRHGSSPPANASSGRLDFFTGSLRRSTTGIYQCHICSYHEVDRHITVTVGIQYHRIAILPISICPFEV
ncbi:unnamed protein product [Rodentolepis nana]|uniref:C2H2-type domain-containing protein n=1 Tax=Rodentolepis nana TaxID=102285 RepID=A0A0R3TY12_RODNA|nr:unnamed protein product [Rodentolepis nana]